ncbi:hypothetical protein GCM10009069_13510 [Algimonas arctica]|uniref:DUF2330 domain-containing protein n=1 Tax=Algimonas arctica TaxID=1479486 RepID=A0A8J3CQS4_9PROT|nr:DUF2330 domain-containing protein [Algimonas arctica]GHA91620.1 hypothetical protein GCM10009069_13510 [Algimonas arctica]
MSMTLRLLSSAIAFGAMAVATNASAFCGFYVAKADTDLFNQSSKVAMMRDGDRTVITMANDYEGEPEEFAIVIPVPTIITKDQVHVSDPALLAHLDVYTAPRLVEYFDDNPCNRMQYETEMRVFRALPQAVSETVEDAAEALGVTIEEEFTVGEYDILILSAKESDGLQTWLEQNGYKVPEKAKQTLSSYIKQDMKFFVAKVNLEARADSGNEYLRPIAVAFESPKFMLPIRLGTVNAQGNQDMFVYMLTRGGQVETTNYRTQKIPTDQEIPPYVKDEFGDFYKSMFHTAAERDGGHGVFMEYAWDMNWCDPCAADPMSDEQLQELGVFWLDNGATDIPQPQPRIRPRPQSKDVFVTRLHVRYDAESFPEDLKFKTTGNRDNFQGRYVMRHAYDGEMVCEAAADYKKQVNARRETEINTLANLTGWTRKNIRKKVEDDTGFFTMDDSAPKHRWWSKLWGSE